MRFEALSSLPRAWRSLAVGACLAVVVATGACSKPLRIERVSPEGELSFLPDSVRIEFAEPILDVDRHLRPHDIDLRIVPPRQADIRFPSDHVVAMYFAEPLPLATRFEVHLDSGLRSADGLAVLRRSRSFSFTTPINRIVRLFAPGHNDPHGVVAPANALDNLDIKDALLVTLAYPAKTSEFERLLTVETAPISGGGRSAAAVTRVFVDERAGVATQVRIVPMPAWPRHSSITVALNPGLQIAGIAGSGNETASVAQTFSAGTYGPLRVVAGPVCEGCRPPPTLTVKFSTPVDCASIAPFVRLAPSHELQCLPSPDPAVVRLEPRPPLLQFTSYVLRVRAGAPDRFGQRLESSIETPFETGDPSAHLLPQPLFSLAVPGAHLEHSETVDGASLVVHGVRLNFEKTWRLVFGAGLSRQLSLQESLEPQLTNGVRSNDEGCHWDDDTNQEVCPETAGVAGELSEDVELAGAVTQTIEVKKGDANRAVVFPLAPYLVGEGSFVVLVEWVLDAQGRRLGAPALRIINTSALGMVVRGSLTELSVFVVGFSDGKPVPDAQVRVYGMDDKGALGEPRTAHTSVLGLATFTEQELATGLHLPLQQTTWLVVAQKQGDEAMVALPPERTAATTTDARPPLPFLAVYTDRDIYRPGDSVQFRLITAAKSGSKVTAQLQVHGHAEPLAVSSIVVGELGTASGSLLVPNTSSVGPLVLRVALVGTGATAMRQLNVMAPYIGALRAQVTIESGPPAMTNPTTKRITVRGIREPDAPASGLPVQVWHWREPQAAFTSRRFPSATFGHAVGTPPNPVGSSHLDATGVAVFNVPAAPVVSGMRDYVAAVISDSGDGDSVAARSASEVAAVAGHLGVILPAGRALAKNSLPVVVVAVGDDDTPMQGVVVQLLGAPFANKLEWTELCGGTTGENGKLVCRFTLPSRGRWRLRARSSGLPLVEADTSIAIVAGEQEASHAPCFYLRTDARSYMPGDVAVITLHHSFAGGAGLLSFEENGVFAPSVVSFAAAEGDAEASLPVPKTKASSLFVDATAIGVEDGRTVRRRATLAVGVAGDAAAPVSVEMTTDRSTYAITQPVHVSIMARDAKGAPVAGEVNLFAVDPAMTSESSLLSMMDLRGLQPVAVPQPTWGVDSWSYLLDRTAPSDGVAEEAPGSTTPTDATIERPVRAPPPMSTIGADAPVALWLGATNTDETGHLNHTFKLPANAAPSYRLTAVVVASGGRVGVGQAVVAVQRGLAIHAAVPGFARPGDEVAMGVFVENRDDKADEITAILTSVDDKSVPSAGHAQVRTLGPQQTALVRWPRMAILAATPPARFAVEVRSTTGHHRLTITIPVYNQNDFLAEQTALAKRDARTIRIRRSYVDVNNRPIPDTAVAPGSLVRVELTVEAATAVSSLRIEDPLAPGLAVLTHPDGSPLIEGLPEVGKSGSVALTPERLVIYLRSLGPTRRGGLHFSYMARAVNAGRFKIPAPRVTSMLRPGVVAIGDGATLTIGAGNEVNPK